MTSAKPFEISKRRVLEAYRHVRANQGAAGIDDESIEMFEANLSRNLYRLWNRMASGSYFPPPVRQVEIAKKSGNGTRVLGIPTVADRIAQQVVKARIEGELEGLFHPDSYGYRPNKSAADAVAVTRERCWKYDWCVEFDIRRAFDELDWDLMRRAIRKHVKDPMGTALHRAMAERPRGESGRAARSAKQRGSTRFSNRSGVDELVHALHLRSMDAAAVSAVSICTLRG